MSDDDKNYIDAQEAVELQAECAVLVAHYIARLGQERVTQREDMAVMVIARLLNVLALMNAIGDKDVAYKQVDECTRDTRQSAEAFADNLIKTARQRVTSYN